MAEKRKFSLVRAFTKAVLGLVTVATLAYGAYYGAFYAGRGDRLTMGETQAVEQVFGDQLDASRIRKHYKDESHITHVLGNTQGMVLPPFSHIDFFGEWARVPDFTRATRQHYGLFLHEVTHTWQGQHLNFNLQHFRSYDYASYLKGSSAFADFGFEQQAELVEDYAENWLHPEGMAEAKTKQDSLVANVVEAQFPRVKHMRDSLTAVFKTLQMRGKADSLKTAPKTAKAAHMARPS